MRATSWFHITKTSESRKFCFWAKKGQKAEISRRTPICRNVIFCLCAEKRAKGRISRRTPICRNMIFCLCAKKRAKGRKEQEAVAGKMEFRRIEYFLVLAEKLNYGRAAAELCISSQALTKQIQLLEEEIGAKLFDRTTRSVKLTEIGEVCQKRFSYVKDMYDDAIADVKTAVENRKEVIRLGIFSALPKNELIIPIINDLSASFGDLDIELFSTDMDTIRACIKDGTFDIGITNAHDFEDWLGCSHFNIKTMPAQICVSKKHRWVKEKKQAITAEDMEQESILLLFKKEPLEFNNFYKRVKTKDRVVVRGFDNMLMKIETGKEFMVIPRAFQEMYGSKLVFYDLPEEYAFKYRTMVVCNGSNKNEMVKKAYKLIRDNKEKYMF